MPNREVIQLWIDALRSGKYLQASMCLRDPAEGPFRRDDRFCCLGVLCDLYLKSPEGQESGARWNAHQFIHPEADTASLIAPEPVRYWAGLPHRNPRIEGLRLPDDEPGQVHNLSSLNDDGGWTFKQLADLIEERFLKEDADVS
jgi:hypothetical protein